MWFHWSATASSVRSQAILRIVQPLEYQAWSPLLPPAQYSSGTIEWSKLAKISNKNSFIQA
jgi:hypothetical protein